MSINSPGKIPSSAGEERPESDLLTFLRAGALIVGVIGAIGSLGFMLRAGQKTPRLLLIFFIIWVDSPFVALLRANLVSKRWSVVTRITLYCVTLLVTLGSLVSYSELLPLKPPGAASAFLFVAVPPVSWIFMLIVVSIAALISRRLSRRGAGA